MDVATNIHDDPVQPSREVAPLVESVEIPKKPKINFLGGILRVFTPIKPPQRCAQHPSLVQQNKLFEGGQVSSFRALNQQE